jgi:copper(I)-binding protein
MAVCPEPSSIMTCFVRVFAAFSFSVWAGASTAAEPPTVADAWVRATPPGASTAAAYLTITSAGPGDRLLGAATPAARAVEIHTHVSDGGLHRMVRLPELTLPAGEAVRLEPGGLHLMLVNLTTPLAPGTTMTLALRFAAAGIVELEVPVVDARAGAAPRAAH